MVAVNRCQFPHVEGGAIICRRNNPCLWEIHTKILGSHMVSGQQFTLKWLRKNKLFGLFVIFMKA